MTVDAAFEAEYTNRLTASLVLLAGREREYHHNAIFHAQVDALVALLPSMVNGMALEAGEAEKRMQVAIAAARQAPLPLFLKDLGLGPKD